MRPWTSIENERIAWVGLSANLPEVPAGLEVIDGRGKTVLPGLIDSHTHLVFAGTRENEELPAARLRLNAMNFGPYPMGNGLSRLATRFIGHDSVLEQLHARLGEDLDANAALELGLVSFAPDDIDWEDEVRIALEERAAFSPDALTAMEASLRFAGPETLETKIFARLSAWQNWIFQRPNAVGAEGALKRYGTGQRAGFDRRRV